MSPYHLLVLTRYETVLFVHDDDTTIVRLAMASRLVHRNLRQLLLWIRHWQAFEP